MPAASQGAVLRAAVSVAQMARMLGMSRSRFYELAAKGIFVTPVYSITTKRPYFSREMQEANLRVRAEQQGVNGEFVLFQERRPAPQGQPAGGRRRDARIPALVQGLRSLGLEGVDQAAAQRALSQCYPQGVNGTDDATLLRTIFRHLRRSQSAR